LLIYGHQIFDGLILFYDGGLAGCRLCLIGYSSLFMSVLAFLDIVEGHIVIYEVQKHEISACFSQAEKLNF
jgi:hypothetical protein